MVSEKRLIDANELKEYLLGLDVTGGNRMYKTGCIHMMHGFVPEVIDAQPTVDAVEVTRCEKCASHAEGADCPEGRVWCKTMCRYMKKEGYCSFGEAMHE
jgi:hypothetical protein